MSGASEIENFFKWVNTTKRIKPCYESLDMRGKVSSPCSRYVINDRVHYLDDVSFRIFQEGLKKNRGVFTVDVYKAVVLQDRAQFDKSVTKRPVKNETSTSVPSTAAETQSPQKQHKQTDTRLKVGAIKFGYFRQKATQPLDLICDVNIASGDQVDPGKILDFTEAKMLVKVGESNTPVPGIQITAQFAGIRQSDPGVDIPDVDYAVDAIQTLDDGFEISLTVIPGQNQAAETVSTVSKYFNPLSKTETDDEYESLLSWYFERTYAESLTRLPFFIFKDNQGNPVVKSFAISSRNRYLASFFYNKSDRYNLSPLCLPDRLIALKKHQSLLVVMYRAQGENDRNSRIHSAAENDYVSREAFLDSVRHAFSHPEHCLVRLSCEQVPAAAIAEKKLDTLVERLRDLSPDDAMSLVQDIEQLDCVGFVSDMTLYAQRWIEQNSNESVTEEKDLNVWVGSEERNAVSGETINKLELNPGTLNPELIRFGYVERRREHRYLARTAILVTIKENQFSGYSSNISWHGLCVKVDEVLGIKPGIMLKIGFSTMQEKRKSLDLMEIPYRVVNIINSDKTELMLERITGAEEDPLDEFFDEIIKKNRHKLKIDAGDVISSISARVYESLAAINSEAITFFIGHHKARGASLLATGSPITGNKLSAYCSLSNTPNPAALLSTESVRILFDAIHLHGRRAADQDEPDSPFGFDMAVYNKADSDGLEVAIADEYSSEGFQSLESMSDWVADKTNCRILRLVATSSDKTKDEMFESMLEELKTKSSRHGEQLTLFIQMLVGCGEIIDVTDQYSYFWP